MASPSPLILTLKLDRITFDFFNELRQQHFPSERNFLPAHITLFHALPGEHELSIQQSLQNLCTHTPSLPLLFPKPRFLGRGVAIEVSCSELIQLRQQLAATWNMWLSKQDQQRYQPHVTIQNKVTSDEARQLYNELVSSWNSVNGYGEGLLLWYYKGGPWELAGEFIFKCGAVA
ncbi:2'-5' RNA ligase family protein [Gloeocapsopsis dulcis]|uniref:Phosphoesterase n=1 Tax=Gloeocapsopsis dulcis AAB1 = 1H9 TaxID=1433147 RepID=A0A6N8G3G2_9CHRO|nr:2'-5' RNA ligase family protein [Gloeocapsopsis dulcis]MUL39424.1 phosphoesterase [Gloeocapsopsis dulcis AAB1 = 1H9]WNN91688.1 2'-5' RNA ligase family protein [Gloeocapsopsis dulcis]